MHRNSPPLHHQPSLLAMVGALRRILVASQSFYQRGRRHSRLLPGTSALAAPQVISACGLGLKFLMPTFCPFPTFMNRVMPGLTGSVVPCQAGLVSTQDSRVLVGWAIVPYLANFDYSTLLSAANYRFTLRSNRRMRGGSAQTHLHLEDFLEH